MKKTHHHTPFYIFLSLTPRLPEKNWNLTSKLHIVPTLLVIKVSQNPWEFTASNKTPQASRRSPLNAKGGKTSRQSTLATLGVEELVSRLQQLRRYLRDSRKNWQNTANLFGQQKEKWTYVSMNRGTYQYSRLETGWTTSMKNCDSSTIMDLWVALRPRGCSILKRENHFYQYKEEKEGKNIEVRTPSPGANTKKKGSSKEKITKNTKQKQVS